MRYLYLAALLALGCTPTSSSSSDNDPDGGSDTDGGMTVGDGGRDTDAVGGDSDGGELDPDAGPAGACTLPMACEGGDDGPGLLNEHSAVFDDARGVMIVFGGNDAVPENCGIPAYTMSADTWLYFDGDAEDCGRWLKLEGDAPPRRTRHAAAFDGQAMWVFGGRSRVGGGGPYTVHSDLWRFDAEARTWTEATPEGDGPPGRYNTSLVYNPDRNELLLFGGNLNGDALAPTPSNDVWAYSIDDNTWRNVSRPGGPAPRMWHGGTFDTARNQMVIYGGGDDTAFTGEVRYFFDLWAFDAEEGRWAELPGGLIGPAGRFWAKITYDSTNDRYLMFGGHDEGLDRQVGNRNDLWSYDPDGGGWAQIGEEDTFNAPANGFCDFPPDFANIADGTPERRNAHSLVWNGACGRALVFGGKTDCGAVDDVWRYDDTNGWTNPTPANDGELCMRWRSNPDNCVNMCF